ncbi:MAG: 16S rRNA (cytidine(1402)-2'-O)-methyltransferase [Desulfobacterales bacterium]|nr:16S rRNA (cytidine(1402)-2'-O)-methyltransferase [Desulfobacterales bacterium]
MGKLYIVATPIGNLGDISFRALEILKTVDTIACEDTRHSMKLLNHYGIKKPLISCRSQNEAHIAVKISELLDSGQDIAYVSDAGTPGLSDPGNKLVQVVRSEGFEVIPIPGVSAFAAIISIAGNSGKSVTFDGFLSPKPGKRRKRVKELLEREESFVLYESPFRIVKLIKDIAEFEPDRILLFGRELTKIYEEIIEGTALELLEILEERQKVKGEISLLVYERKKS